MTDIVQVTIPDMMEAPMTDIVQVTIPDMMEPPMADIAQVTIPDMMETPMADSEQVTIPDMMEASIADSEEEASFPWEVMEEYLSLVAEIKKEYRSLMAEHDEIMKAEEESLELRDLSVVEETRRQNSQKWMNYIEKVLEAKRLSKLIDRW